MDNTVELTVELENEKINFEGRIVEKNATVGIGSIGVQNVLAGSIVAGNPAKPFEKK